jgi:arylsulfatase A-like enzyme
MRRALTALLILGACSRAPAPTPRAAGGPAAAAPAGDAIVFHFADHAGAAQRSGPSLVQAFGKLDYPAKLADPYSDAPDGPRVVELALSDADVSSFGTADAHSRKPVRFDAVWNRTRAVYESRRALFSPGENRYQFTVPATAHGELALSLAVAPDSGDVEFAIAVDGSVKLRQLVRAKDAGVWFPLTLSLPPGAHQVAFASHGEGAGFFGDPVLVDRGAGAPAPNVLFVVIDTLRADALPATPRLRALAAQGAYFSQAITAATWTRPSVVAMLGGDLPSALGQSAEDMIPKDSDRRRFYAVAPPLLPRVLAKSGRRSVAIGNNFFLLGYPQIGLTLGFDEVDDIRHPVLDTPAITRAAIRFMSEHKNEPWFLHLHYDAPHWPYTPPREYLERVPDMPFPSDAMARAYLAEAAYADDYLGQVIDALDQLGLSSKTLVIVVGDHGEVFDHAHAHTVAAVRQPTLHHHGWSGYDELLRVPLVVRMPGKIEPRLVKDQVSLIDVEPTIREACGIAPRAGERGRSLFPLMRGGTLPARPAFTEGQNVRVIRAGGFAYLRRADGTITLGDGKTVNRKEELYDLLPDPLEHNDVATRQPIDLARMRVLFEAEAPMLPEAPVALTHLALAPDVRTHVVTGTVRSNGALSIRGLAGAEAAPLDAHSLQVSLRGEARLDLAIDPSDATLEIALAKDGTPLPPRRILIGQFALPLLAVENGPTLVIDGEQLAWLDAARAPAPGSRGDVLLWRDRQRRATPPFVAPDARASSEVASMMRRWGYAQQGGR